VILSLKRDPQLLFSLPLHHHIAKNGDTCYELDTPLPGNFLSKYLNSRLSTPAAVFISIQTSMNLIQETTQLPNGSKLESHLPLF
jgi:hypothetical protein